MAKVDEATEAKIQQLQLIEQSLTNLLMQRQQFQTQLIEIDSALSELENTDTIYKIVGNIMISSDKEKIRSELTSKKEVVELRIKNLEKQENQIKEKAKKLQSEVLSEMKGGEKNG
jgi:prefoldin beta subunit